ncbi:MAG: MOSC domain-containing protein [Candidatus Binatia bacterium]
MSTVGVVREIWRYPVKSMGGERVARCTLGPLGIPGDRGWALRDEQANEIRGAKKLPALLLCGARYRTEPTAGPPPPAEVTLPDGTTFPTDDAAASERLSVLLGRPVTLWPLQPPENRAHYRRGIPDHPDMIEELRHLMGREPDEPLPDFSVFPPELYEFTSPLGTYFDAFPIHLVTTASLRALAGNGPAERFDRRRFRPNFLVETTDALTGLVEADWSGRTLRVGRAALRATAPTVRCGMPTQPQPGLSHDPTILRTIVRDAGQNVGLYLTVTEPGAVTEGDTVELA